MAPRNAIKRAASPAPTVRQTRSRTLAAAASPPSAPASPLEIGDSSTISTSTRGSTKQRSTRSSMTSAYDDDDEDDDVEEEIEDGDDEDDEDAFIFTSTRRSRSTNARSTRSSMPMPDDDDDDDDDDEDEDEEEDEEEDESELDDDEMSEEDGEGEGRRGGRRLWWNQPWSYIYAPDRTRYIPFDADARPRQFSDAVRSQHEQDFLRKMEAYLKRRRTQSEDWDWEPNTEGMALSFVQAFKILPTEYILNLLKDDDVMPRSHREILGRPGRTIYDHLDFAPVDKAMLEEYMVVYSDSVIRQGVRPVGERFQGLQYNGSAGKKNPVNGYHRLRVYDSKLFKAHTAGRTFHPKHADYAARHVMAATKTGWDANFTWILRLHPSRHPKSMIVLLEGIMTDFMQCVDLDRVGKHMTAHTVSWAREANPAPPPPYGPLQLAHPLQQGAACKGRCDFHPDNCPSEKSWLSLIVIVMPTLKIMRVCRKCSRSWQWWLEKYNQTVNETAWAKWCRFRYKYVREQQLKLHLAEMSGARGIPLECRRCGWHADTEEKTLALLYAIGMDESEDDAFFLCGQSRPHIATDIRENRCGTRFHIAGRADGRRDVDRFDDWVVKDTKRDQMNYTSKSQRVARDAFWEDPHAECGICLITPTDCMYNRKEVVKFRPIAPEFNMPGKFWDRDCWKSWKAWAKTHGVSPADQQAFIDRRLALTQLGFDPDSRKEARTRLANQ